MNNVSLRTEIDLNQALDFARETAREAGEITLRYFQHDPETEIKPDDSPVTIADKEAERFIRSRIADVFPGHAVLGEEFGESLDRQGRPTWIIDPIDGTRAFVRGVPLYGVLVGLELDGEIRVGVAHFPALSETVYAAEGLGCWWNGRPARVSETAALDGGIVVHCNAERFGRCGKGGAWQRIQEHAGFIMGWGDAYGYMLVATGRAELMLDAAVSVWDCGPFPVIFREAGGYFGNWSGERTIYGGEAMATTDKLLPEVLDLLKDY